MKSFKDVTNLIVLILLVFALTCQVPKAFAAIQGDIIADKVISRLKRVRSTSSSCETSLRNAKDAWQNLNANYGTVIDSDDKTKLTAIFVRITTAITDLNLLVTEIDNQFPSIRD